MTVVIGGRIKGATVVSGGSVVIDGKIYGSGVTVIQGEPLPEVKESFDNIQELEIEGGDIFITQGQKFKATGRGYCKQRGDRAVITDFEGEIESPNLDRLFIQVNSGSVRGNVATSELNVKANSGDVHLGLSRNTPTKTINAKANSGNITINLV